MTCKADTDMNTDMDTDTDIIIVIERAKTRHSAMITSSDRIVHSSNDTATATYKHHSIQPSPRTNNAT